MLRHSRCSLQRNKMHQVVAVQAFVGPANGWQFVCSSLKLSNLEAAVWGKPTHEWPSKARLVLIQPMEHATHLQPVEGSLDISICMPQAFSSRHCMWHMYVI